MSRFAPRPEPPYYAVIFTSQRTDSDLGYEAAAQRMAELAAQQSGYLGIESTRDEAGLGITVSYFKTLQDIAAWRSQGEHAAVRDQGRAKWYSHYELRVAKVERAYGWDLADKPGTDPNPA
jgi:heme-degrading monooxygenase HmoA